MISLFTEEEFNSAKSNDKLPCQCKKCGVTFLKRKHAIVQIRNKTSRHEKGEYCSYKCVAQASNKPKHGATFLDVSCLQCKITFQKRTIEIARSKKHFCSRSCAGTYNTTHKTHGTRRSKLEVWLEQQLTTLYPSLEFHFNRKDAINAELDIYIPSLKLAFELNGLFHYEPIFGQDKLAKIQTNDARKFQACLENGIELCLIDVSSFSYFKPEKAQKYLNIIQEIMLKRRV